MIDEGEADVDAAGHDLEHLCGQRTSPTAARRASPASSLVRGWAGWALTTTGQPAANADAVSPPGTEKANGKLLAANTTTGPIGTFIERTSVVARVETSVQPAALLDLVGEQAELAGRSGELAA